MIKKEITYTDYNNVERKENFYFNLNKAELMDMEFGTTGGFSEMVNRLIETQDQPTIMRIFKEFILKAYGEKSADGREFNKSEELSRRFSQTEAFSVLYMELLSDTNKAVQFINGIVPADIAAEAAKKALPVSGE